MNHQAMPKFRVNFRVLPVKANLAYHKEYMVHRYKPIVYYNRNWAHKMMFGKSVDENLQGCNFMDLNKLTPLFLFELY